MLKPPRYRYEEQEVEVKAPIVEYYAEVLTVAAIVGFLTYFFL